MNARGLLLVILGWSGWAGHAEDFSTINSDKLGRFEQLLEAKSRPVRILSFGESMADSYRSPTYKLITRLHQKYGAVGYSFSNYGNTLGIALTNGVDLTLPNAYWFTRYYTLPPDAAVWWERSFVPGGNFCDHAGFFYVAYPQGGTMTLAISTNAGPWGTLLTLDCYSPTAVGRFTNVVLAPNLYRVRAQSVAGTNIVLGPFMELSQANGIHISFMDWQGISVNDIANVPRSIRDPIMAALKPDLLIWHMKESPPWLNISNQLNECEDWWRTSNPDGEVLYIGTSWVSFDTNSTLTMDQNRTVRGVAVANQRAYVDLMQPAVSYPWLVSQGYMQDEVHMNPTGGQWGADVMWNDLGFFALGLPRTLSLRRNSNQWQVTYPTATGAAYTLQTSSNLLAWTAVATVLGNGQTQTNSFPAGTNNFFRLKLQPPS